MADFRWSPNVLLERRRNNRRPSDVPLVWVALALSFGFTLQGWLANYLHWPQLFFFAAIVSLLLWLRLWLKKQDSLACAVLLATIAMLSACWGCLAWSYFDSQELGRFATRESEPICLEAVALASPVYRKAEEHSPFRAIPATDRSVLLIRATRLRNGTEWIEIEGRCEVVINESVESIQSGDHLRLFGQLSRPTPLQNLGGRDPAGDARAERRLCTLWSEAPECVIVLQADNTCWSLVGRRYSQVKVFTSKTFDRWLSPATAGLAKAMILGDRSAIDQETIEIFRHTGAMHLLVVSGLHVSFVAFIFPMLVT